MRSFLAALFLCFFLAPPADCTAGPIRNLVDRIVNNRRDVQENRQQAKAARLSRKADRQAYRAASAEVAATQAEATAAASPAACVDADGDGICDEHGGVMPVAAPAETEPPTNET